MTTTAVQRPPIRGLRRWYAVLAGIAWWMVHLVAEASLARVSCLHPDLRWVMHAITIVTALGTLLAIVWSAQMLATRADADAGTERPRGAGADEGNDPFSRQRFLGLFGVGVGAISLLLILWEGSYVLALSSCAVLLDDPPPRPSSPPTTAQTRGTTVAALIGDLVTALVAVAYLVGLDRLWVTPAGRRLVSTTPVLAATAGLVALVVVTNPPFDPWADRTLAGHMAQHVVLLALVAPLLALGEIVPVVAWSLPTRARRAVLRRWRPVRRELAGQRWPQWLTIALVVQLGAMLGWHLTGPYQAAARHPIVHLLEHASFVVTSAAFFWVALRARRRASGLAILAVFIDSLGAIAIGAALIVDPSPLYPLYAIGHSTAGALADQQLAGVIMWAYGGALSLVMGIGAFAVWLRRLDRAELGGTAPTATAGSAGVGAPAASGASRSLPPPDRLSPAARS